MVRVRLNTTPLDVARSLLADSVATIIYITQSMVGTLRAKTKTYLGKEEKRRTPGHSCFFITNTIGLKWKVPLIRFFR